MVYFKLLRNHHPLVHNFNLVEDSVIDRDEPDIDRNIYKVCKTYRENHNLLPGEIFGVAWFEDKNFLGLRIFQVPVDADADAIDMKVETPVQLKDN